MSEGVDYFVRVVDFPIGAGSNGMLLLNDDNTYSVYINARASRDAQEKAMQHEYNHMARGDMFGEMDIAECEEVI